MSLCNIVNIRIVTQHDLIIKDLVYDKHTMIDLPMPNGEYMVIIKSSTSKILRIEFKIYVTRSD